MTKLPALPAKFSAPAALVPVGLSVAEKIVSGVIEYKKTAEIEKTKRKAIKADKAIKLAQIDSDYKLKSQDLKDNHVLKKKALKAAIQFTAMSIDNGDREMQEKYFGVIADVLNK